LWDAAAITDAVRQGAQVILVGEAGDDDSPHLDQAVAGAIAKGAVVIQDEWTSAGDPHGPAWPADLPGVIGAGGVTLPGLVPPYRSGYTAHTARGPSVVVAAPSNTFFQAGPQGVSWMWGSATADAWVVSTAALIKAVYPHLAPALVAQALALSANDHPAGGYNTTVGFGLINPAGALHEAATLSPLKTVAAAGPAVAAPGARLASGPAPGVVSAVRHGPWLLAGLGGAVVLGVVLIVVAVRLRNDRRRAPEVATYVWQ
jgi:hypothetical protein